MPLASLLLAAIATAESAIVPGSQPGEITVTVQLTSAVAAELPGDDVPERDAAPLLRLSLVDEASGKSGDPILGRYARRGETLAFTPRYRLVPGNLYRVEAFLSATPERQEYRVPPLPAREPATVVAIYPTAKELPANLLKFYIDFSRPMREGRAIFDRVQLVDEDGLAVEAPWRATELWNNEATQLTLWIHPGRVKTGVGLRDDDGPVLVAGKTYTLVVSDDVQDADGQRLGKKFTKRFRVTAADHELPNLSRWKVARPLAGKRAPITIEFDEPLDCRLIVRCLHVIDASGQRVGGTITTLHNEERLALFVPDKAWGGIDYQLTVDETLEDLAGNTPIKAFEVDLEAEPVETPPPLFIKFQSAPPPPYRTKN